MIYTSARIKAPYAAGRTGATLHRVNPKDPRNYVRWVECWWGVERRAEITVKTMCKFPSMIHDAILLNVIDLQPSGRKEAVHLLGLCSRCFGEEERGDAYNDYFTRLSA